MTDVLPAPHDYQGSDALRHCFRCGNVFAPEPFQLLCDTCRRGDDERRQLAAAEFRSWRRFPSSGHAPGHEIR